MLYGSRSKWSGFFVCKMRYLIGYNKFLMINLALIFINHGGRNIPEHP